MPKLPDSRAENNPWPEWPRICKTDYGQQEAITVFGSDPRRYQTTVKEFVKDEGGNLKGVVIVNVHFVKDENGRNVMQTVEGSEQYLEAELVLIAAGFLGPKGYIADALALKLMQEAMLQLRLASLRQMLKRYSQREICTEDNLLLYGLSERAEMLPLM